MKFLHRIGCLARCNWGIDPDPHSIYGRYKGGNDVYQSRYGQKGSGEFIKVVPTDLGLSVKRLLPGSKSTPPTRHTEPQKYGQVTTQNGVASTIDLFVLAKPSSTRVFLVIQNNDTLQNLFVTFGGVATTTFGLRVTPGQALFFDAFVPQDDIHIIADGGTPSFIVAYSNKGPNEN
jgi:hypothetical protein